MPKAKPYPIWQTFKIFQILDVFWLSLARNDPADDDAPFPGPVNPPEILPEPPG